MRGLLYFRVARRAIQENVGRDSGQYVDQQEVGTHGGPVPIRLVCRSDDEFESQPGSQPSEASPEQRSGMPVMRSIR